MSDRDANAVLIAEIEHGFAPGLETEWWARAYRFEAVRTVILRLQSAASNDAATKLHVAGFTPHPYVKLQGDDPGQQGCETCMYDGVHRQFCELPELMLPVKPQWSCRLWRI